MSAPTIPAATAEDRPAGACPYRGLMPFREADAPYFFGRAKDARIVSENLMSRRLTLFYAPSGVGKSSVLLAGVAHDLSAAARARVDEGHAPGQVPVVVREWAGDAHAVLEAELRDQAGPLLAPGAEAPAGGRLPALLDNWARALESELLLVLDQFEEFLLYHGYDWDSADGVAAELAAAMAAPALPVNFLIAMREDAVASLDLFKGPVPHVLDNVVGLGRLDRDAAREAIVKPIERWNADHNGEMKIQAALVDAVLKQVTAGAVDVGRAGARDRAAKGTIEAPYLQLVMTRVWEREREAGSNVLRLTTLEELGGATAIVRSHLDVQLDRLSDSDQDIAAAAFDRLVTPSGAKIALSTADLAAWTQIQPKPLQRVLDDLAYGDRRIIRAVAEKSALDAPVSYELFHDSLAEAVLDWRSRHLARRNAEAIVEHARLEVRRRWKRRLRRTLLVIGVVFLLVVATLAAIALYQRGQANKQRDIVTARGLASDARAQMDADPELAVLLAREGLRVRSNGPAPAAALRAALAAYPGRGVLLSGTLPADDVEPIGTDRVLAWGEDGHFRVWRVKDRRKLADVDASTSGLTGAQVSRDDQRIATTAKDGAVAIWDIGGPGARLALREPGGRAAGPRWDASGRRLLARVDGAVWIWDAHSGRRLRTLSVPGAEALAAEWRPDAGDQIVTTSSDGAIRLWDASRGRVIRSLRIGQDLSGLVLDPKGGAAAVPGIAEPVPDAPLARVWNLRDGSAATLRAEPRVVVGGRTVAFDHSGTRVATSGFDRRVRLWDARDGTLENVLAGIGVDVVAIAFSPDDQTIATGGIDGTVQLWNAATGDKLTALHGHALAIRSMAFLPSGELATASDDGEVRLWAVNDEPVAAVTPKAEVDQVMVSRDGRRVLIATAGGVELWNGRSGRTRSIPLKSGANVASPNRDATLVAVGSAYDDNPGPPAVVLRLSDGRPVGRPLALPGSDNGAVTAVFSPDDKLILTTHRDGAARLWDASTHRLLRRLGPAIRPSADATLVDGRFSADGRRAATVGKTGVVRVFDVASGRELESFVPPLGRGESLNAVAFQPQGELLATVGVDGNAHVWNLKTRDVRVLPSDDAAIAVAFSPGGGLLATTSADGTARLWDARTGEQLKILERVASPVISVAFSPDGRRVVTSDLQQVAVLECDVCRPTGELLTESRQLVSRDLTPTERRVYLGGSDG